ncbi:unnamed protein product [Moneuplotes crassus]|uniref:Uncharacterized protein n=1 Tax=Euplotes crassus TaxID=5936 RepID=A0AAD1UIH6_EUPCR|nr:unnamed protein product [Moneuplotes crassus]
MSFSSSRKLFDFSLLNTTKNDIVKGFWNIQQIKKRLKRGLKKNHIVFYKSSCRLKAIQNKKKGINVNKEQIKAYFKPSKGRKEFREFKVLSKEEANKQLKIIKMRHNMSADMARIRPKSRSIVERKTINNCTIEKHSDALLKTMTSIPKRSRNTPDYSLKVKPEFRKITIDDSNASIVSQDGNNESLYEASSIFMANQSADFSRNMKSQESMKFREQTNTLSSLRNSFHSKSIGLRSRNFDVNIQKESKKNQKDSKPKRSNKNLVSKLGSGDKISVDNFIDWKIQKNLIFRTYRPDYSQLKVYETDFSKFRRKVEELKEAKNRENPSQRPKNPEAQTYAQRYTELKQKWTNILKTKESNQKFLLKKTPQKKLKRCK